MSTPARIAVLMTCFNRRALTLTCLETLRGQAGFNPADLWLVDDGSRDGTGDAVQALFPQARVIRGDGSLFWNGGMRLAWSSAKADLAPYDFYLWLNDDVELAPGALDMLVADADTVAPRGEAVIISAATVHPGTQWVTYGASLCPDRSRPLRMNLLLPQGIPVPADTISGNVVLVSAAAERALGNLLPVFEHIYGDLDYGLRARARGIPVALASKVGGTCASNQAQGTTKHDHLGRFEQFRLVWRESRRVHRRDWLRLVRLHEGGGMAVLRHRIGPYLRILAGRPNLHAKGADIADPNRHSLVNGGDAQPPPVRPSA